MSIIMLIGFFVLLFFVAKGIFTVLAWAAPLLIVAALVINYRTVLGYLRFLWDLLRRKPLMGILAVILSVVGFPIVSGFLLGKSILDRKISSIHKEIRTRQEGELVDYEDVTDRQDDVLELKPPKQRQERGNKYSGFFEDDARKS